MSKKYTLEQVIRATLAVQDMAREDERDEWEDEVLYSSTPKGAAWAAAERQRAADAAELRALAVAVEVRHPTAAKAMRAIAARMEGATD
jgi:uncharacterized protein YggE